MAENSGPGKSINVRAEQLHQGWLYLYIALHYRMVPLFLMSLKQHLTGFNGLFTTDIIIADCPYRTEY